MNDTDGLLEELLGNEEEVKISLNDKRRFNADGERIGESFLGEDAPKAVAAHGFGDEDAEFGDV